MKQLHKHVIPKIAADWRKVAEFLELDSSTLEHVKERCGSDPTRCCEEVFREWLKVDKELTPKTWSMLITTLKEIDQQRSVAEQISQDLKINCEHIYNFYVAIKCKFN